MTEELEEIKRRASHDIHHEVVSESIQGPLARVEETTQRIERMVTELIERRTA